MQVTVVPKRNWSTLLQQAPSLVERLDAGEVFIIRGFMEEADIDAFKAVCLQFSKECDDSWHPCLDGCQDYHRLHNMYPNAHVPALQHGYYFHTWNDIFPRLIESQELRDIFELKRLTGGLPTNEYFSNRPSQGPIARLVSHQYPRGGGGQAEHVDPVSPFAKVQTIIQASQPGTDYLKGGFYINDSKVGVTNIDALTRKGDLILASPGVRHGVAAVDPDEVLDWSREDGRWIIMPIIINSDYISDPDTKPKKVGAV